MSMDSSFYDNGIHPYVDETEFSSKQWIYGLDQNSGVYSNGQVQFDLSTLSNAKGYLNWSEGYIVLPVVMQTTVAINGAAAVGLAQADLGAALKNGFYQLINSCVVRVGDKDLVNLTQYTNMFINYKVLTSMSVSDLSNLGSSIGVSPDSSVSSRYEANNAAVPVSVLKNNSLLWTSPSAALAAVPTTYNTSRWNEGLFKRALTTGFNPSVVSTLISEQNVQNNLRNYTKYAGAGNVATDTQVYFVEAVIRLKDLHDVFAKMNMPISGAFVRLYLNLNIGSTEVVCTKIAAGAVPNYSVSSVNIIDNTFPAMLTDIGVNSVNTTANKITLNVQIAKIGAYQNSLGQCRVYLPLYKMTPAYEAKYLESGTKKRIRYNDIISYTIPNQSAGSTFNQIVTNTVINPKKLIVIPMLSASANGGTYPIQSPITSEPGTSSYQASLSNFNVAVNGMNLYQNNINYDWDEFIQEVRPSNGLDGNINTGLSCGLIGQNDWQNQYRTYVVDLSRRLPEQVGVNNSISILGQINTLVNLDLYCFVEWERSFTIDITTGETDN